MSASHLTGDKRLIPDIPCPRKKRNTIIVVILLRLRRSQNVSIVSIVATYMTQPKKTKAKAGSAVAVDMGEIHPIVAFDGNLNADIYNGREHRSKVRYREKSKASINRKLSRCKRGSKRWKKLKRAKDKRLSALTAQLRDMRHKITSRFVSACHERRIETIVIGDIKHIRQSIHYGKKSNEKLHQWAFSKIRKMITYKARSVGIKVDFQDEAYTSQTCPSCGHTTANNASGQDTETSWVRVTFSQRIRVGYSTL